MKGMVSWAYRPFRPQAAHERTKLPFVCRIAPFEGGFEFEWVDAGSDGAHELTVKKSGETAPVLVRTVFDPVVTVDGLEDLCDYTFTVSRVGGEGSVTRLVRTGKFPGDSVVNYLCPHDQEYSFSGFFLAGPNVIKCPSGKLIASMDVFFNKEYVSGLTLLYYSEDGGISWRYLCDLFPCYWDVVIGRSDDEGKTCSAPVILFGSSYEQGYHSAPGTIVERDGVLSIAVSFGGWKERAFRMGIMSVRTDSDLLDPASWELSDLAGYDPSWENAPRNAGPGLDCPGAGIEGNVVVGPDGILRALYRMDIYKGIPNTGKLLIFKVDPTDRSAPLIFDRIADCPLGSNSKFCVDFDPVSGLYVMIGTEQSLEENWGRTVISMAVSSDLYSWRTVRRLYDHHDMDPAKAGLQYPDFKFDGDDILMVLRLGWNCPDTYHNSNCISFTRVKKFRQYF